MKTQHRPPSRSWFAVPVSDPVDADYEREVQHTTDRGEREHRQAQERLKRAEQRLARAHAQKQTAAQKKVIRKLEALIIERCAELAELERLMIPADPDKKLIFRTGRDNHLELGVYVRPDERRFR